VAFISNEKMIPFIGNGKNRVHQQRVWL